MIKEITMYTAICDGCGKDVHEGCEISAWGDKGYVEEVVMEADWIREGGEHYCTDCFKYDDDDNLIISKKDDEQQQKNNTEQSPEASTIGEIE
ncbi:MAG: hypothetical protein ACOVOQ_08780 [Flavobacterium sp.]|jgi:hypothetical protein